jgi:hypothetical protein
MLEGRFEKMSPQSPVLSRQSPLKLPAVGRSRGMKSVPPRGSGWATPLMIGDRKSAIGMPATARWY